MHLRQFLSKLGLQATHSKIISNRTCFQALVQSRHELSSGESPRPSFWAFTGWKTWINESMVGTTSGTTMEQLVLLAKLPFATGHRTGLDQSHRRLRCRCRTTRSRADSHGQSAGLALPEHQIQSAQSEEHRRAGKIQTWKSQCSLFFPKLKYTKLLPAHRRWRQWLSTIEITTLLGFEFGSFFLEVIVLARKGECTRSCFSLLSSLISAVAAMSRNLCVWF